MWDILVEEMNMDLFDTWLGYNYLEQKKFQQSDSHYFRKHFMQLDK